MLLVVAAIVAGAGIGALRRPRGAHVHLPRLILLPLLVVGVVAHLFITAAAGDAQGFWLGASLVAIGVFAILNRQLVGMLVIAAGVWCNAVVIAIHGAMPVRASALVRAGHDRVDLATLDLGGGRRFERTDDLVPILGDVIPVAPARAVVSIGDVVALVGVAIVSASLARYARRGSRWSVASWLRPPRETTSGDR